MGRYLVTFAIAVLLLSVQFDLSLSSKSRGSSSSSSSSSRRRGSSSSSSSNSGGRKPGRPASSPSHNKPKPPQSPAKPPQTQPRPPPSWPKPPQTQPKPPPSWPKPSQTRPKPVETQPRPDQIPQRHDDPIKPAPNPGLSQHNPPSNPAQPPHNPSYPQNPGQPQNPAYPPHNPNYPQNPGQPQNPAYPPHNPNYPQNPGQPQNPAYPPHNPNYPQNPGQPQNPAYPPHNPNYPQNPGQPQNPAYPPHNPNYPQNPGQPQNPAYPPHNPNYPQNPGQPQNPAYPPHNPNYPQNPGQPQNPAYPPHNPNYPQNPGQPQNPAYPPHNPNYPQNPGQPQNPAYPPHNPNYPQNPGHPQNPGYPHHNPGYPQLNPGYPHHPGYPQNPGWDHSNVKPWKPKQPKLKIKHVAGAAVAGAAVGALSGYVLGNALSNMHFRFNNYNEEQWWYANRNRYPDRVYFQKYDQPVSRDVFVGDCVNITVKENIEPTGNQTEDEMEMRVVTRVVYEMCVEQYRLQSSGAEGSSSSYSESKPEGHKTVELEASVSPQTDGGSLLSNMHFRFNSSDEEQWWHENRHRYRDQVYYPNYSQPVSRDDFVSDCWNATLREYVQQSGNQTADEMEFRVMTQVALQMCTEQYLRNTNPAGRNGSDHDDSKPGEHESTQHELKQVAEAAVASSELMVLHSSVFKSTVPNVHFHFDSLDEERWWYKNHNYSSYPVFFSKHSQSITKDDFLMDCWNATFNKYRNQMADELATRATTQGVHIICAEHYNLMSGVTVLLASPSMLSIIMLVSCFLIHPS